MRVSSVCAAAVLAAGSVVALAAPVAAEDCLNVDRSPVLCAGASAVPDVDTSDGVIVGATVDADVCSSLVSLPTCDRANPVATLGDTGVTGVTLSTRTVGGTPVHVPEVCLNTSPCVGPYDDTLPTADVPCAAVTTPVVYFGGYDQLRTEALAGTC